MSDKGGMIMGIYYSDKVKSTFTENVMKSDSRYTTKLKLKVGQKTFIRMIRKRDITFDDSNSSVYIVSPIEEFRPDLIANRIYGSEHYSWVILAANNLSTFFDVKAGQKLIIPSIVSLQGIEGKLVTQ